MRRRLITIAGLTYEARREALRRDGGDPPGEWYAVRLDPELGAVIDSRHVPTSYYRTMRACHEAIRAHVARVSP